VNPLSGKRIYIAVDATHAAAARCELLCQFATARNGASILQGARFSVEGLDKAFGGAEVRTAVVEGLDLRYVYVNESYRNIRSDVPMIGRTYREVFPEAAAAGAEAKLQCVITTGASWIVEDYATPLPNRDVPAWWEGECVPVALRGEHFDAVLILIWDVTRRHLGIGSMAPTRERTRVEAGRAKLMAQMAALGLTPADGWRISEEVRETESGTIWILRPIHMRKNSPPLEVTVEFERSPDATR
jgi:PAS domain-containing protein